MWAPAEQEGDADNRAESAFLLEATHKSDITSPQFI
jgi:hypothetical protein